MSLVCPFLDLVNMVFSLLHFCTWFVFISLKYLHSNLSTLKCSFLKEKKSQLILSQRVQKHEILSLSDLSKENWKLKKWLFLKFLKWVLVQDYLSSLINYPPWANQPLIELPSFLVFFLLRNRFCILFARGIFSLMMGNLFFSAIFFFYKNDYLWSWNSRSWFVIFETFYIDYFWYFWFI